MGSLEVVVVEARNLMAKDWNGKSDPFVVLECEGTQHKTVVMKKTLDPVWQQRFIFKVSDPHMAELYFECRDKDFLGSDLLGTYRMTLHSLVQGEPNDQWLHLQNAKHGDLHVIITPQFKNGGLNTPAPRTGTGSGGKLHNTVGSIFNSINSKRSA